MFYFPARRRLACRISLTPDPQHSTTSCARRGALPGILPRLLRHITAPGTKPKPSWLTLEPFQHFSDRNCLGARFLSVLRQKLQKINAAKLSGVNHSDVVAQIDSLVSYAVPLNDRLFFASERGLFKRPFSNLVKDVCKVGIKSPPGVTPGVPEVPPDPGDPAAGAGGDP